MCFKLKPTFLLISKLAYFESKARYRNTLAGFVWVLLSPVAQYAITAVVFQEILRIKVVRYLIYLHSGLLPWIFLSGSIVSTTATFVSNRNTLLSLKLDPKDLLYSKVLESFLNFFASFFLIFIFLPGSSLALTQVPYLILSFIVILSFACNLSLIFATLHVFFRDTQFVVQYLFMLLSFLTPIYYHSSSIPIRHQWMLSLNPFEPILSLFQISLWGFEPSLFYVALAKALTSLGFTTLVAHSFWKMKKDEIYFYI